MNTPKPIAEALKPLIDELHRDGLTVYMSKDGRYGFYTDDNARSLISFGLDYGMPRFSGNYKSSQPSQCGTGWRIENPPTDYRAALDKPAPHWATGAHPYRLTTVAEHLKTYGASSGFYKLEAG